MSCLILLSFVILSYTGYGTDNLPAGNRTFPNSVIRYSGGMARSVHPLTFLPGTISPGIESLQPIYGYSASGSVQENVIRRDPDYIFSLSKLHARHTYPDLNETVNGTFIISHLSQDTYPSMISLSPDRYLYLQLDNDIFNYTDRFYTNGIQIALILPELSRNPLTTILIPYKARGRNYYGLTLVQNMFTPSTTKLGGILKGDRPYAAYLYVGTIGITNDARNRIRMISELQIGILGPSSLGEYVQRTFHNAVPTNNEPLGWEYQIRDDLLLNYMARFEKGVVSVPGLDMMVYGSGYLGTVYTNISCGTYIRSGWFNSYFLNLFYSKRAQSQNGPTRNFQFYFFSDFQGKVVGYDATLQGGLINKASPYTIASGNLNRIMFIGTGGIVVSYKGFQLKGEQFIQSPEFEKGWWHKWLSIGLTFSF